MRLIRIVAWLMTMAFAAAALPPAVFSAEAEPAADEAAPKPKPKKPAKSKKKKNYDYEKSKYKAYRALTDSEPRSYKFDQKGNPIPPAAKKKKPAKKKEKPRPPEDEIDGVAPLEDKVEQTGAEPAP